jgi:hypothetical protein
MENKLKETEAKETVAQWFGRFQQQLQSYHQKLMNAIKYDAQSNDKMLKDLEFLNVMGKLQQELISKYEVLARFFPVPFDQESYSGDNFSSSFEGMGYIDSYSKLTNDKTCKEKCGGFVHMTVDKMSIMFNLANCYSRMSSRLDLTWNPDNNQETGVLQACDLYQRAAGIFKEIEQTIVSLRNLPCQDAYNAFQRFSGCDLNLDTIRMLRLSMLAQAQYLLYNNMAQKISKNAIDMQD